jgi:hypothetical protein
MRTLAAFGLGIVVGVAGLLTLQHPRMIEIFGAAMGVTRSPPQIRSDDRYPHGCDPDPQVPCK